MHEVTRILSAIEEGDPHAAEQLLPLIYAELRKLAAERMAQEKPGQTLQATALVHEAYVRLVDDNKAQHWDSRGHFFAAAAEAMRRILVESARKKKRHRHGGGRQRVDLLEAVSLDDSPNDDLLRSSRTDTFSFCLSFPLRAAVALPSDVRGPVATSHHLVRRGCHTQALAAFRCQRPSLQPIKPSSGDSPGVPLRILQ